jgi:Pyruvate/2-oxoacid:ferredoxin oxidoreductase delta subunit
MVVTSSKTEQEKAKKAGAMRLCKGCVVCTNHGSMQWIVCVRRGLREIR